MATVTLDRMVYTRILSEDLGESGTAVATVVSTGLKDDQNNVTKASTIQVTHPQTMSEAQLTALQTFIGGLDEICTALEAELYKA